MHAHVLNIILVIWGHREVVGVEPYDVCISVWVRIGVVLDVIQGV